MLSEKKRKSIHNKIVKDLKGWLDRPQLDSFYSKIEGEIEKLSKKEDQKSISAGLYKFTFMATLHGQRGLCEVLAGNVDGWSDIEKSFDYRFWNLRVDSCMTTVMEASLLLVHALANNDVEKIEWLRNYQERSFNDNVPNTWPFSSLGRFGLVLCEKARPRSDLESLDFSVKHAPSFAPYEGIFENWHGGDGLVLAIEIACDYHLSQVLTESGYPDFKISPYGLMPIEIIALIRVRERLGLGTPLSEHPLLNPLLLEKPCHSCQVQSPSADFSRLLEKARAMKMI